MSDYSKRILLVEDVQDIRVALRISLELEGYECDEAADGIEALAILAKSPLPALILLDMLMPRMNGWEFVEQVKKDLSHPISKIPIIAVTATEYRVHRTPGYIQGVVKKPVDLAVLYDAIRSVWGTPN